MADNLLTEVSGDELSLVLEEMKKDWPNHFLFHGFIKKMQEYKNINDTNVLQTLFCNGDLENGLYILKTTFLFAKNRKSFFFVYTKSSNESNLVKVLMDSSVIPWGSVELEEFELLHSQFTPAVLQAVKEKNAIMKVDEFNLLWLLPEVELDLMALPEEVYLHTLDENNVKEVHTNWHYNNSPISYQWLSQQIKNNFSLGVFRKSNKQLLSYALSYHSGGIYVLHTGSENRRKGYASIIVKHMARHLREKSMLPYAVISLDNMPSQNLFKKIGFTDYTRVDYVYQPNC